MKELALQLQLLRFQHLPNGHKNGPDSNREKGWDISQKVRDEWVHVLVDTKVVEEVKARCTAYVVELDVCM